MAEGLAIPGDLGWITILVVLIVIAWRVGTLKERAGYRAILAGAGVAVLTIPATVWLGNAYSLPNTILAAVFYGSVVTATLLVWFTDRLRTGISS